MTTLVATLVAFIAAATAALTVSAVLNDWIWLSAYMLIVPTAIATVAARRVGPGSYPALALATVLVSALALSLIQVATGYMDFAAWYLFIAVFPVTLVIGTTSALIAGLAHWKMQPATA